MVLCSGGGSQRFQQHIEYYPTLNTPYGTQWLDKQNQFVCIIVLKEEIRNNLAGAHREEHGRRAVWLFLFLCYWLMKMFLTAKKAAEKLGINVAQFRRCVERGEIPPPCLNCRPKR